MDDETALELAAAAASASSSALASFMSMPMKRAISRSAASSSVSGRLGWGDWGVVWADCDGGGEVGVGTLALDSSLLGEDEDQNHPIVSVELLEIFDCYEIEKGK